MRFLFLWVPDCCIPPRWMAYAYYSCERRAGLFVIYPVHFLIALLWWAQDKWARHAHAQSWIEQEVRRRIRRTKEFSQF